MDNPSKAQGSQEYQAVRQWWQLLERHPTLHSDIDRVRNTILDGIITSDLDNNIPDGSLQGWCEGGHPEGAHARACARRLVGEYMFFVPSYVLGETDQDDRMGGPKIESWYSQGATWVAARYPNIQRKSPNIIRKDFYRLIFATLVKGTWEGGLQANLHTPERAYPECRAWIKEFDHNTGKLVEQREVHAFYSGSSPSTFSEIPPDLMQEVGRDYYVRIFEQRWGEPHEAEISIRFGLGCTEEMIKNLAVEALRAVRGELGTPSGSNEGRRGPKVAWSIWFERFLDWWTWREKRRQEGLRTSDDTYCSRTGVTPECWVGAWDSVRDQLSEVKSFAPQDMPDFILARIES